MNLQEIQTTDHSPSVYKCIVSINTTTRTCKQAAQIVRPREIYFRRIVAGTYKAQSRYYSMLTRGKYNLPYIYLKQLTDKSNTFS